MNLATIIAQDIPPILPDSIPSRSQEIEMLKSLPFDELVNKVVSSMVTFSINLAIAILVFYAGKFIIAKIHKILTAIFIRRKIDKSLSTFMLSLIRMLLYFILIVTVIGILGIETSSFIAIFASAGVAIGMALSGTLQNFAGGVLILLLKPYRVGDYIEASGYTGTVKEIQIFHTVITTPDNKSIIVPNGGLSTGSINNYSRERYRRVDWSIAISYGDNVADARKAILDIIYSDPRVLKDCDEDDPECIDPELEEEAQEEAQEKNGGFFHRLFHRHSNNIREKIDKLDSSIEKHASKLHAKPNREPRVYVSQLADSSVNLSVRAWTKNENYWPLFFDLNERFYTELPNHGVNFPFPQIDVHIQK